MNFTFIRSNRFSFLNSASLRLLVSCCLIACVSQDYAYSQSSGATTQNVELSSTPNNEPRASEILSEFFFGRQNRELLKPRITPENRQEDVSSTTNSTSVSTLKKFFGLNSRRSEPTTFAGETPFDKQPFEVQNYAYPPSLYPESSRQLADVVNQNSNLAVQQAQKLQNQGQDFVRNVQNQISRDVRQFSNEASQEVSALKRQGQTALRNAQEEAANSTRQISDVVAQNARTLQRQGRFLADDVQSRVSGNIQRTSQELDQQVKEIQRHGERLASDAQAQASGGIRRAVNAANQKVQNLQQQGRQIAEDVQSQLYQTSSQAKNGINEIRNEGRDVAGKFERQTRLSLNQASRDAQNLAEASRDMANQISEVGEDVGNAIQRSKEEIAAARRRRLDELNALLSAKRPEEFAQRTAHSRLENRFEFDVARENRSKIRQASSQEATPSAVESLAEPMPVRPRSLQVANKRSNPAKANALQHIPPKKTGMEQPLSPSGSSRQKSQKMQTQPQQSGMTESRHPRARHERSSKNVAKFSVPSFNEEQTESLEDETITPESGESHDQKKNGVIRSSARFIDPKDL